MANIFELCKDCIQLLQSSVLEITFLVNHTALLLQNCFIVGVSPVLPPAVFRGHCVRVYTSCCASMEALSWEGLWQSLRLCPSFPARFLARCQICLRYIRARLFFQELGPSLMCDLQQPLPIKVWRERSLFTHITTAAICAYLTCMYVSRESVRETVCQSSNMYKVLELFIRIFLNCIVYQDAPRLRPKVAGRGSNL